MAEPQRSQEIISCFGISDTKIRYLSGIRFDGIVYYISVKIYIYEKN